MAGLTGAGLSSFLLAECDRCSMDAAKGRVAEFRALLRYLFLRGLTPTPLAATTQSVADWHHTSLPPTASADGVQALLDSCDRGTPGGYVTSRSSPWSPGFGLRSIEVASEVGGHQLAGRCGHHPQQGPPSRRDDAATEVGQAVAGYLVGARLATDPAPRRLFLTCRARRARADLFGDVVERACRRVGMPLVGPHLSSAVNSHAPARQMLTRGCC
ncbi:hypothetical protein GCM10027162_05640 [Streptomyces incanus]